MLSLLFEVRVVLLKEFIGDNMFLLNFKLVKISMISEMIEKKGLELIDEILFIRNFIINSNLEEKVFVDKKLLIC